MAERRTSYLREGVSGMRRTTAKHSRRDCAVLPSVLHRRRHVSPCVCLPHANHASLLSSKYGGGTGEGGAKVMVSSGFITLLRVSLRVLFLHHFQKKRASGSYFVFIVKVYTCAHASFCQSLCPVLLVNRSKVKSRIKYSNSLTPTQDNIHIDNN